MPKRRFPRKGVQKFYLMHGETIADVIERAEQADQAEEDDDFERRNSKPARRPEPIEHEDGTVEFADDPDYDRKDYEFGEYGFPDDGHDYSQYFRTMGQSKGVFVAADGTVSKSLPLSAEYAAPTMVQPLDPSGKKEDDKEEVSKMVTKKMVKDGEFILREDMEKKKQEEDSKNEEDDNAEVDENGDKVVVLGVPFVVQERDDFEMQKELHYKTMEKPDAVLDKVLDEKEVNGVHVEEMPDDFIQQLMQGEEDEEDGEWDEEYYDEDMDDDEYEEQISRRPPGDALAGLEEQFDEVLKEYESDDIGDLSGDEGTCGQMSVQDILAHLEAEETKDVDRLVRMGAAKHILSGPLVDHQYKDDEDGGCEEITLEDGTRVKKLRHRKNKKLEEMLNACTDALDEETRRKVIAQLEKSEREGVKKVAVEVPDEDEDPEERWDCESVLSTLSTTSNVPSLIEDDDSASNKRKQRAAKGPSAQPIIVLSKKTGMPVEVLREQQQQNQAATAGGKKKAAKKNLGEARKDETPEEKKARKKAVKQAAREKRAQKKQLKVAYKEAETKQTRTIQAQAHSLGGQSVIHM